MKSVTSSLLLILILPWVFSTVDAQTLKSFTQDQVPIQGSIKLRKFASLYFEMGEYQNALPLYVELANRYPSRAIFLYRAGVCHQYSPGGAKSSIGYLEKALHLDPEQEGLAFHLGKAFLANNDFDLALNYFNHLLAKKNVAKTDQEFILRLKESCLVGKELVATPLDIRISNMGAPINTAGTEYVPLLNADESTLIFTYKRKALDNIKDLIETNSQYDDILVSYKKGGKWSQPVSISKNINTNFKDEAAVGISPDGTQLLILKFTNETSGDIYVSNNTGGDWSKPEKLKGDINTATWEGSASFSGDGKVIYFDSEREGGFGGTDIYSAELQSDSSWGNVVNLGATVNTPYNDEAPFMHSSSNTLYFSSDGHKTMGGFDLFKTTLDKKGNWSTPVNLGYPINSTSNDKYYVLSTDGKRGYYHKDLSNGFGDLDLYMVNYDLPALKEEPMIAKNEEDPPKKSGEAVGKELSASPDKVTTREPIKAAKAPISISGSVVSSASSSTRYSKARIKLVGDGNKTIAETKSNSKGEFIFKDLSGNDNYKIEVVIDEPPAMAQANTNTTVAQSSTARRSNAPTSNPARKNEGPSEVQIANHSVCKSVENRSPKGEASSFLSSDEKIWFYTEVTSPISSDETITHKWYYKGKEISSVDLQVKGPRWRTYSNKNIEAWMKGSWKVEAISSKGMVLADKEFQVN